MNQLRYRNLQKVDDEAEHNGDHRRRPNDRVHHLLCVGLPGDPGIAIGPDQDIKDGVVAACIQQSLISKQCLNQWKPHIAGIGKDHRKLKDRGILLPHTTGGQHGDDEADHDEDKGVDEGQHDAVKNLGIKFCDIGIHDHTGHDDRYQKTGEVLTCFRLQGLRLDCEESHHDQHKKDDDLTGRNKCKFHEASLIWTEKGG